MDRLIRYDETPQVSGIEYKERFDMERDPKKAKRYETYAEQRRKTDATALKEVAKAQKGFKKRNR